MRPTPFLLAATILLHAPAQQAGDPHHASTLGHWGAQPNNTYINPILPADFSDLDAIRVGDSFYAISSTMQYSPGMAVLASPDLVNWRIVSHVVADIAKLDPQLGWQRMNRPGRGIWAGSIRFHAGLFRVYFGTPDGGIYVSTAPQPSGPWTPPHLVIAAKGWDDPCPFWDDDGQGYLVATRFAPDRQGIAYRIHLFRLLPNGSAVDPASDRILHQSQGSEANKLYKVNGVYLHYFSEVHPEGRVAMIERATSLTGPWEIHQLNHVNPSVDKEPNQGGLIQLADTSWWFLSHQGTGDWEGRAAVLLPVAWLDGWPIIGTPGPDRIGTMVWGGTAPIPGQPPTSPFAADSFHGTTLDPAWEWRYQPRSTMWSLIGTSLRLRAFPPLPGQGFNGVRNILTQRSARASHSQVSVQMDLSGMSDGQEAGLAHFASTNSRLAIVRHSGAFHLTRFDPSGQTEGPALTANTVWLRSTWEVNGLAHFSYSLDGDHFTDLGAPYQLTWANYRGDRIGLYTFSQAPHAGYADFHDFTYQVEQ